MEPVMDVKHDTQRLGKACPTIALHCAWTEHSSRQMSVDRLNMQGKTKSAKERKHVILMQSLLPTAAYFVFLHTTTSYNLLSRRHIMPAFEF